MEPEASVIAPVLDESNCFEARLIPKSRDQNAKEFRNYPMYVDWSLDRDSMLSGKKNNRRVRRGARSFYPPPRSSAPSAVKFPVWCRLCPGSSSAGIGEVSR